eukprot:TRINITY_DN1495_c0_g1_i1.p1 TRINITY_DN1495_c0_g1~~TRINITY_DN1495_c0_g1_i1.p1  ORF type:complete len:199 (-),score=31.16 TRINITY_DN1495_c0_g1_i1:197-793(-)
MNSFNHFFTAFNILFIIEYFILKLYKQRKLRYLIISSIVFAVCIDFDMIFGYLMGNPSSHLRTWFQEPFMLILAAPWIAFICSKITKQNYYIYHVYVGYGSHILLDYLTAHEVCPFAPFSYKIWITAYHTAIFHAFPSPHQWGNYGISEIWWLVVNVFASIVFFLHWRKIKKSLAESKLLDFSVEGNLFKPPEVDFAI